ncbi:MAG TPA: hypothetical protein VIX35_05435 [Vicinamibacterales bacterium]
MTGPADVIKARINVSDAAALISPSGLPPRFAALAGNIRVPSIGRRMESA